MPSRCRNGPQNRTESSGQGQKKIHNFLIRFTEHFSFTKHFQWLTEHFFYFTEQKNLLSPPLSHSSIRNGAKMVRLPCIGLLRSTGADASTRTDRLSDLLLGTRPTLAAGRLPRRQPSTFCAASQGRARKLSSQRRLSHCSVAHQ